MNTPLCFLATIAFASQSLLCVNAAKAETPINSIPLNSNLEVMETETAIESNTVPPNELISTSELALEETIAPEAQSSSADEASDRVVIRSRIFDTPSMCQ
jgi:hypothetical protein